jgi:hypothetical protein
VSLAPHRVGDQVLGPMPGAQLPPLRAFSRVARWRQPGPAELTKPPPASRPRALLVPGVLGPSGLRRPLILLAQTRQAECGKNRDAAQKDHDTEIQRQQEV